MIRKYIILFSLPLLFAFFSCKKQSASKSDGDFLQIQIAGKSYRSDIYHAGTGFSSQSGCVAKPHFLGYLSMFETSTFEFDAYISYLENEVDFKNVTSGMYGIQSQSSNAICNLNLAVSFLDKSLSTSTTNLQSGGINQVTSISKVGTTSTGVRYRIKGNFSCSFRNSAGSTIPITGDYQYTAEVLQ